MKFFKLCILYLLFFTEGVGQDTTQLSLLFAGDIMGHDSQIASAYDASTNTYDYSSCFQFIEPYLKSADLAIGNLELTLAGPPFKGYPQFSSPDALAHALKEAGFDVLVTANNHSADRGGKGIERTIRILDSLSVSHTGTFTDEVNRMNDYPLLIQKNGFSLSLLNYTYGTNGMPVPKPYIVNLIDTAQIHRDLDKAKGARPDIIIVFMHWGDEYQSMPNKQQRQLADFCFRHGADFVIGAHPHVLQPMEWRKDDNKIVVYSLGNFVSGQRDRYKNGGALAYVKLKKIRHGEDSIQAMIDSTGYYLEWVYRTVDSHKDYYILPVPSFENDALNFIKDEGSWVALKTFAEDSRSLFGKHNLNFSEITRAPVTQDVRYKVIVKVPASSSHSVPQNLDTFYGYEIETDESGATLIVLGDFLNFAGADKLYRSLLQQGKEASVVKYQNGQRID